MCLNLAYLSLNLAHLSLNLVRVRLKLAPCRAFEAVGRVQRLLRQLGVIWGGAKSEINNGLKQVNVRFKWANMIFRLH